MANNDTLLGTYSPEDLTIIITAGGYAQQINGYVDGTFINITREVPAASLVTGADNTAARVIRANKSATITLSLLQTAAANDFLTQIFDNDQEFRDTTWIFSILIKDNTGRSFYYDDQAFIGNSPDSAFSSTVEGRDWVIHCRGLQQYLGGNAQFSPATAQALEAVGGVVDARWAPNA